MDGIGGQRGIGMRDGAGRRTDRVAPADDTVAHQRRRFTREIACDDQHRSMCALSTGSLGRLTPQPVAALRGMVRGSIRRRARQQTAEMCRGLNRSAPGSLLPSLQTRVPYLGSRISR